MSRAMRRHPSAGKRQRQERGQRPPIPRPQRKEQQERKQGGGGITSIIYPHWAAEIVTELRKVTWPSREDTWYLTFVVLVVAGAFGVFLGGVDMFFNWAIERTIIP